MNKWTFSILLPVFVYSCTTTKKQPNDIINRLLQIKETRSVTNLDVYFDSLGYEMQMKNDVGDSLIYYIPKLDTLSDKYMLNNKFSVVALQTLDYKYYIDAIKGAKLRDYKEVSRKKDETSLITTFNADSLNLILLKETINDRLSYSVILSRKKDKK